MQAAGVSERVDWENKHYRKRYTYPPQLSPAVYIPETLQVCLRRKGGELVCTLRSQKGVQEILTSTKENTSRSENPSAVGKR